MEREFIIALGIFFILSRSYGLPRATTTSTTADDTDDEYDEEIYRLSYKKYLREVMTLLMADEDFKKKIMSEGKELADKAKEFSMNLEFMSHSIRSRLDELKRKELDRLRNLLKLKTILKQSVNNVAHNNYELNAWEKERLLGHLDHQNVNTFEASDLEKLIVQTSRDLQELDRRRRETFKIYEMEKELERRRKMEGMDEERHREEEEKNKMMEKKHKDHPKMHHPGNEAHLLDIWEKIDGLDKKDFDRKTFFHLHDVDSDGIWSHNEVEALFQSELDKVYDKNAPEDDVVERYEEMSRMREHFISEADSDGDGMIDIKEFMEYSSKMEFQSDEEWKAIDGREVFDENDLKMHKIKLEKLKLESLEGIAEELEVDMSILGNASFSTSSMHPQLKIQTEQDQYSPVQVNKQQLKNLSAEFPQLMQAQN